MSLEYVKEFITTLKTYLDIIKQKYKFPPSRAYLKNTNYTVLQYIYYYIAGHGKTCKAQKN